MKTFRRWRQKTSWMAWRLLSLTWQVGSNTNTRVTCSLLPWHPSRRLSLLVQSTHRADRVVLLTLHSLVSQSAEHVSVGAPHTRTTTTNALVLHRDGLSYTEITCPNYKPRKDEDMSGLLITPCSDASCLFWHFLIKRMCLRPFLRRISSGVKWNMSYLIKSSKLCALSTNGINTKCILIFKIVVYKRFGSYCLPSYEAQIYY